MNEAIANVIRTQSVNPTASIKADSDTAKATEAVTGGLNLAPESVVSSKYDTLNLSNEYVNYRTKGDNTALHDQTSQLNSTVLQLFSSSSGKKPVYNYQLYAYTDSELLDMFNQGAISMEEYEAEVADRDINLLIQRKKESQDK
jgi:hypothetical protein